MWWYENLRFVPPIKKRHDTRRKILQNNHARLPRSARFPSARARRFLHFRFHLSRPVMLISSLRRSSIILNRRRVRAPLCSRGWETASRSAFGMHANISSSYLCRVKWFLNNTRHPTTRGTPLRHYWSISDVVSPRGKISHAIPMYILGEKSRTISDMSFILFWIETIWKYNTH